jgi:hypothetical protein
MRLLPLGVLFASLPAFVVSDGASIVNSMQTISNATIALGTTVSSWHGTLLGTIPIVAQSTSLLDEIRKGADVAKASANLTTLEAIQVAQATRALAAGVNATLETLIAAENKFDRLLLGPIILLNLKLEKDATEDFSGAVIQKTPEGLRRVAQILVDEILAGFDKALDTYKLFGDIF